MHNGVDPDLIHQLFDHSAAAQHFENSGDLTFARYRYGDDLTGGCRWIEGYGFASQTDQQLRLRAILARPVEDDRDRRTHREGEAGHDFPLVPKEEATDVARGCRKFGLRLSDHRLFSRANRLTNGPN